MSVGNDVGPCCSFSLVEHSVLLLQPMIVNLGKLVDEVGLALRNDASGEYLDTAVM